MDNPSTCSENRFGLMFCNARWLRSVPVGYDPSLGRFAQADTIVPSGSQGLDRYAYGLNNPSRYTDPSGHVPVDCYARVTAAQAIQIYCLTLTSRQSQNRHSRKMKNLEGMIMILKLRKMKLHVVKKESTLQPAMDGMNTMLRM
ncbi:MAG: hypothetical protein HC797_07770 [Anaerolineales bacterium]|nr:hypothetical protein [Anaerolineales bacterium]